MNNKLPPAPGPAISTRADATPNITALVTAIGAARNFSRIHHRRQVSASPAFPPPSSSANMDMDGFILSPVEPPRNGRGRRTDENVPLRLLSLDGGGVRGFSTILLIQELMLKVFVELEGRAPRADEIPKPADHFDLIGGTGTGGLIAILLGRLRMDLEMCKAVYVRVSKKVFETDKTIAGIPYRKTLFKASLLEEAIKEVVKEMTMGEDTDTISMYIDANSSPALSPTSRNFDSGSLRSFTSPSLHGKRSRWGSGNENAPLHDPRPHRCRAFVTAVYKGSDESVGPAILRTYDSSHTTAPSQNCTIWEAGRATCAHFPAFKPIQIGQDIFLDEGPGRYSPIAQVLEEAIVHEWPRREVGVIVSIGSGKKPGSTSDTSSLPKKERHSVIHSTPLGKFADARDKHMQKMEDTEAIHQEVLSGLHRTGVDQRNYVRLNVETGLGDFGINEWSRMADISTNTRKYLTKPEVQRLNRQAAEKLASIHRQYWENAADGKYNPCILNRELPSLPAEAKSPGIQSYRSFGSYASSRTLTSQRSESDVDDEEVNQHLEELEQIQKHIQA